MSELFVFFQRRVIGVVLLAVAGWLGLEMSDATKTQIQTIALGISTLVPAVGYLWSYVHKLEGRELRRRLIAGVIPCVYVLLGVLAPEMGDEERSEFSKQVAALIQSIIGQPSSEVLGLMGAGGLAGISSYYLKNPIQPTRLASPNP